VGLTADNIDLPKYQFDSYTSDFDKAISYNLLVLAKKIVLLKSITEKPGTSANFFLNYNYRPTL